MATALLFLPPRICWRRDDGDVKKFDDSLPRRGDMTMMAGRRMNTENAPRRRLAMIYTPATMQDIYRSTSQARAAFTAAVFTRATTLVFANSPKHGNTIDSRIDIVIARLARRHR